MALCLFSAHLGTDKPAGLKFKPAGVTNQGEARVSALSKCGYERAPLNALKAASQDCLIRLSGPCAHGAVASKSSSKSLQFW